MTCSNFGRWPMKELTQIEKYSNDLSCLEDGKFLLFANLEKNTNKERIMLMLVISVTNMKIAKSLLALFSNKENKVVFSSISLI